MKFTKKQKRIIQSLIDFKPKLTRGKYLVLTTTELYHMEVKEFISLCKVEIPEEKDLIVSLCIQAGSNTYLEKVFRKSLIVALQRNYVTVSVATMKKKYPSFFKHNKEE